MPSSEVPLPTFLIIGAQKSGTRWLRINLGQASRRLHRTNRDAVLPLAGTVRGPRVSTGIETQFSGWAGEPIVGEATPGYMMWRHRPRRVAERIAQVVPDVRLIAILRNPVDRAQSALIHSETVRQAPAQLEPARGHLPEAAGA